MATFIEKEITGEDLKEVLELTSDDICVMLFRNYFFKKDVDQPPRFEVNDYFKLPTSKFNTKKEVWTTIGIYIVNLHLIQPKFAHLVGYVNSPFNGKMVELIENILSESLYYDNITTNDMADYYNRLQWLAGHDELSLLTPSITPALLKPPPGLMKKKQELLKKYEKELSPSNPNNALIAAKIEAELIAEAEKYLKDQEGYENFESGSKINISNNYKTMNIMKGPLLNSYTGQYNVNSSEYNTGVKKEEYVSISDSSVLGSHARAINTAKGGYLAKKTNQALNAVQAGPKGSDCKTKKTYDVYLYPEMIDDYLNRYIIDEGKIVELTSSNIDKYVKTTVHMRSPIYCIMEEPCFCNICLGNQPYLLGLDNFGLAVNRISNKLLTLSMKKFHDLTVRTENIDPNTLFDFK